ncbi:hypothetical protein Tco_0896903 [Tanacetum coccineum]
MAIDNLEMLYLHAFATVICSHGASRLIYGFGEVIEHLYMNLRALMLFMVFIYLEEEFAVKEMNMVADKNGLQWLSSADMVVINGNWVVGSWFFYGLNHPCVVAEKVADKNVANEEFLMPVNIFMRVADDGVCDDAFLMTVPYITGSMTRVKLGAQISPAEILMKQWPEVQMPIKVLLHLRSYWLTNVWFCSVTCRMLETESGFYLKFKYFREWDEVGKYLSRYTKVDDNGYSKIVFECDTEDLSEHWLTHYPDSLLLFESTAPPLEKLSTLLKQSHSWHTLLASGHVYSSLVNACSGCKNQKGLLGSQFLEFLLIKEAVQLIEEAKIDISTAKAPAQEIIELETEAKVLMGRVRNDELQVFDEMLMTNGSQMMYDVDDVAHTDMLLMMLELTLMPMMYADDVVNVDMMMMYDVVDAKRIKEATNGKSLLGLEISKTKGGGGGSSVLNGIKTRQQLWELLVQ